MKRLLVVGQPRSGTTLLANFFHSQARITLLNEMIVTPFQAVALRRRHFDQPLTESQRSYELGLLKMELGALNKTAFPIKTDQFRTLDELYTCALSLYAKPDDRLIGNKICGLESSLPLLLSETDVHCLYLVRDPRDVVLSLWKRGDTAFDFPIHAWKEGVRCATSLVGKPRFRLLRYEDLVTQPHETLTAIASWLQVPIETTLTQLNDAQGGHWIANSSFNDVNKVFDGSPLGRWKTQTNLPAVRYAAWACRREIDEFGYETMDKAISIKERLIFDQRQATLKLFDYTQTATQKLRRVLLPPLT